MRLLLALTKYLQVPSNGRLSNRLSHGMYLYALLLHARHLLENYILTTKCECFAVKKGCGKNGGKRKRERPS